MSNMSIILGSMVPFKLSLTLSTKADKTDRSNRIFLNRSRMEERLSADKLASAQKLVWTSASAAKRPKNIYL